MRRRDPRPPLLGRLILRITRLGARRTEIAADLEEQFLHRRRTAGVGRAGWRYVRDAASLLRPAPGLVGRRQTSLTSMLSGIRRDAAFALRLGRRRPGVVTLTVVGLGLAIGVSTAVFSLVNAAALRSVGVTNPESVFSIGRLNARGQTRSTWSPAEWRTLRERSATTIVEALVPESVSLGQLSTPGGGESVPLHVVSGGYLHTFGARPVLGRLLIDADDEPGSASVAVISEGFWRRRLAGAPEVLGQTVDLEGTPATIVGIVDRAFSGPSRGTPGVWVPFPVGARIRPYLAELPYARLTVRVRPGVERAAAAVELSALAAALESTDSAARPQARVQLGPMDTRSGEIRTIGLAVLGAVVLVLLLATANMANLFLASAAERHREVAVRLALGSGRWRVAAQLVTEGLTFSAVAAAIGLIVALWLGPLFAELLGVPLGVDVRFDARVYIFLAAATLFVGGLAGIAPVRYSLRRDLASPMKGWTPAASSGSPRTRAALVAIQASTSMLLLIMTAILARSVVNVSVVDLGFDPERILMVRAVPPSGTCDDACSMTYGRLAIERLTGLPEVEAVGVTTSPPMVGALYPLIVQQGGSQEIFARVPASADYGSAMSLRLTQGRFYTDAEARSGARVAVVSEALARIVWPAGAVLGQPLDHLSDNLAGFRVIGVASDAANSLVPRLRRVGVYVPIDDRATATFMVRTRSDAADVVPRAHAAVSAIRPGVRVTTEAMIDVVAAERAPVQAIAGVASTVAFVALGLAVIGLYGITAFVVGQRTREIGVRMALGAGGRNVAGLFARQSLFPVLVGLVTGVGLALAAGHVLSGPILGVSTTDPASYAAAVAVLAGAAAAAIVSPARRAARVDPAAVLRQL